MTEDSVDTAHAHRQERARQDPHHYTGYLLRRAQQAHVAAWTRIVSTEISSVQYAALAVLDLFGPMSQRELCDAVDLDRSTVADLVARMERRGLLERRPDPLDGRRKTLSLTAHGAAERARLLPLVDEVEQVLTGALDAEVRSDLRDALRAMLDLPTVHR